MYRVRKKTTSFVIAVLCIAITLASITNVFIDNTEVKRIARDVICKTDTQCNPSMTSEKRNPIGQSFTFQQSGKQGGGDVEVSCRRAYIVFGEYNCEAK